jgi:hypothetical protein
MPSHLAALGKARRLTFFGMRDPVHCSFCHKSSEAVRKVVAGPDGVFICNECVDLSHDLIHDKASAGR